MFHLNQISKEFKLDNHPDMTLDVYRGRKATTQQQQQHT